MHPRILRYINDNSNNSWFIKIEYKKERSLESDASSNRNTLSNYNSSGLKDFSDFMFNNKLFLISNILFLYFILTVEKQQQRNHFIAIYIIHNYE